MNLSRSERNLLKHLLLNCDISSLDNTCHGFDEVDISTLVARFNNAAGEVAPELLATDDKYLCLGISTGHLSKDDVTLLKALTHSPDCNMVMARDTGWFMKLFEERDSNLGYLGMSEHLARLITMAHASGCRMIEFDCDATEYEALPLFEHE